MALITRQLRVISRLDFLNFVGMNKAKRKTRNVFISLRVSRSI